MSIVSINAIIEKAKKVKKKPVIAVVEAQEEHTIQSVIKASEDGIAIPIFIGDVEKIRKMLSKCVGSREGYEIIQSEKPQDSVRLAAQLVNKGIVTAIMKGKIGSGDLIRAILDKNNDLLIGRMLSLAGIFAPPRYHKIFAVSDVGLNTRPDLNCKKAIIENAVLMLRVLGVEKPKVAVLAAFEKASAKMPEAIDAQILKNMNENKELVNCIIEGPISFDLATSKEAVKIKDYDSPVGGDADLLVVPDIVSGNILAKCLTGFSGSQTAGAVLGAKVPIAFSSRSAEIADKYNSIALAVCISG